MLLIITTVTVIALNGLTSASDHEHAAMLTACGGGSHSTECVATHTHTHMHTCTWRSHTIATCISMVTDIASIESTSCSYRHPYMQWNPSIPTPWSGDTSVCSGTPPFQHHEVGTPLYAVEPLHSTPLKWGRLCIQWNPSIPPPWSGDTSVYSGTPLFHPPEVRTPLCAVEPLYSTPLKWGHLCIQWNPSIPLPEVRTPLYAVEPTPSPPPNISPCGTGAEPVNILVPLKPVQNMSLVIWHILLRTTSPCTTCSTLSLYSRTAERGIDTRFPFWGRRAGGGCGGGDNNVIWGECMVVNSDQLGGNRAISL